MGLVTRHYKRLAERRFGRPRLALGSWRLDHVRSQGSPAIKCSAGVIEAPVREEKELQRESARWLVTVYDNDQNTYEQVMAILMLATNCDAEEAYMEAWEIDHLGKSVVHHAGEKECREAAGVIAEIGIRVAVTAE